MRRAAAALAATLLATGCGSAGGATPGERTLTVSAASSLTEAFTVLGHAYEVAHPGSRVRFNFGSSASLAQQVVSGAPVDVLATASEPTMRTAADAGRIDGDPAVFAGNALEIAVPPGNPAHVRSLADLGSAGVQVALCADAVPCGAAAAEALRKAGVAAHPVTLERDVKAVLTKVRLGEVDAGIVYRTDVHAAAGHVTGIEIPEAQQVRTRCLVAVVGGSGAAPAARDFVALVRGEQGRATLRAAGFDVP